MESSSRTVAAFSGIHRHRTNRKLRERATLAQQSGALRLGPIDGSCPYRGNASGWWIRSSCDTDLSFLWGRALRGLSFAESRGV
jgi:hypothetical protein